LDIICQLSFAHLASAVRTGARDGAGSMVFVLPVWPLGHLGDKDRRSAADRGFANCRAVPLRT